MANANAADFGPTSPLGGRIPLGQTVQVHWLPNSASDPSYGEPAGNPWLNPAQVAAYLLGDDGSQVSMPTGGGSASVTCAYDVVYGLMMTGASAAGTVTIRAYEYPTYQYGDRTVTLTRAAPRITLSTTGTSIAPGGSVTLSWTVSGTDDPVVLIYLPFGGYDPEPYAYHLSFGSDAGAVFIDGTDTPASPTGTLSNQVTLTPARSGDYWLATRRGGATGPPSPGTVIGALCYPTRYGRAVDYGRNGDLFEGQAVRYSPGVIQSVDYPPFASVGVNVGPLQFTGTAGGSAALTVKALLGFDPTSAAPVLVTRDRRLLVPAMDCDPVTGRVSLAIGAADYRQVWTVQPLGFSAARPYGDGTGHAAYYNLAWVKGLPLRYMESGVEPSGTRLPWTAGADVGAVPLAAGYFCLPARVYALPEEGLTRIEVEHNFRTARADVAWDRESQRGGDAAVSRLRWRDTPDHGRTWRDGTPPLRADAEALLGGPLTPPVYTPGAFGDVQTGGTPPSPVFLVVADARGVVYGRVSIYPVAGDPPSALFRVPDVPPGVQFVAGTGRSERALLADTAGYRVPLPAAFAAYAASGTTPPWAVSREVGALYYPAGTYPGSPPPAGSVSYADVAPPHGAGYVFSHGMWVGANRLPAYAERGDLGPYGAVVAPFLVLSLALVYASKDRALSFQQSYANVNRTQGAGASLGTYREDLLGVPGYPFADGARGGGFSGGDPPQAFGSGGGLCWARGADQEGTLTLFQVLLTGLPGPRDSFAFDGRTLAGAFHSDADPEYAGVNSAYAYPYGARSPTGRDWGQRTGIGWAATPDAGRTWGDLGCVTVGGQPLLVDRETCRIAAATARGGRLLLCVCADGAATLYASDSAGTDFAALGHSLDAGATWQPGARE